MRFIVLGNELRHAIGPRLWIFSEFVKQASLNLAA